MSSTRTTFYLPDALRKRLKALAANSGTTVTELLTEGAKLVLARHPTSVDSEELRRRAQAARETLRRGLYRGPALTEEVDELVHPLPKRRRRATKPRARSSGR